MLTSMCCHAGEAAPNRRQVWIVARQHPGESMAEWFMEGNTIIIPTWGHFMIELELISAAWLL